MKQILLVIYLFAGISVFSQKLVTEYLRVNISSITNIDAIDSETYKYQISWDNPNFRYDWLDYYEIPYVIIDNQEDYNFIRHRNARTRLIDFDKYVLFVCLIMKSSCSDNQYYGDGKPTLNVYYDKEKKTIYLCFYDTGRSTLRQGCKYVPKQVSFLIPRKYYDDTKIIHLNYPSSTRPKPGPSPIIIRPTQNTRPIQNNEKHNFNNNHTDSKYNYQNQRTGTTRR